MIKNIVHNIPFIPPALNNSFNFSFEVIISVSTKIEFKRALIEEDERLLKISG